MGSALTQHPGDVNRRAQGPPGRGVRVYGTSRVWSVVWGHPLAAGGQQPSWPGPADSRTLTHGERAR